MSLCGSHDARRFKLKISRYERHPSENRQVYCRQKRLKMAYRKRDISDDLLTQTEKLHRSFVEETPVYNVNSFQRSSS